MSTLSDFDDWSWSDAPILGEVSNESTGVVSSFLGGIFDTVKGVKDISDYWTGDYGQSPQDTMNGMGSAQNNMLGSVEQQQQMTANSILSNPLYVAAGIAALGLLYIAMKK